MTSNNVLHHVKLGKIFWVFIIAGIGVWVIVGTASSAYARRAGEQGSFNARPTIGETCFATLDDGATVFSSTDSSALGQAIDAAVPGAIVKAAGYCPGSGLSITQSLILRGGYTNTDWLQSYPVTQSTTLDGVGAGQVLNITAGAQVTLHGITITGGQGYSVPDFGCGNGQSGGGIYNEGQLTVIDTLITTNAAGDGFNDGSCGMGDGGDGGGIYNAGRLTVINSTLSNNRAGNTSGAGSHLIGSMGSGGAIYNTGTLVVRGSRFINNTTGSPPGIGGGDGGSIGSIGSVGVSDSTFFSNTATFYGGAIESGSGSARLDRVVLEHNSAAIGGALDLWVTDAVLTNTLVTDNSGYSGSGITEHGTTLRLINCTVANNTGSGYGLSIDGAAVITNSIIVSQATGLAVNDGATALVNGVLWFGNTVNYGGGGAITVTHQYTGSPAFHDPDAGDYHLTAVSAAINRGVADGVLVDLDGTPRYGAPDLGAYEYQLPWKFYLSLILRHD